MTANDFFILFPPRRLLPDILTFDTIPARQRTSARMFPATAVLLTNSSIQFTPVTRRRDSSIAGSRRGVRDMERHRMTADYRSGKP